MTCSSTRSYYKKNPESSSCPQTDGISEAPIQRKIIFQDRKKWNTRRVIFSGKTAHLRSYDICDRGLLMLNESISGPTRTHLKHSIALSPLFWGYVQRGKKGLINVFLVLLNSSIYSKVRVDTQ